jgi:exodeoxyribonuclease-3
MKIVTYNVNGLRAALKKGFLEWLAATNADVVCLQEIKCLETDIDPDTFKALGYEIYWHPAKKKGYSGLATLTKITPKSICIGCGIEKYDDEGRVLRIDFETFSVVNVYMPSGSSGEERQAFKYIWMDDFFQYIQELRTQIPNLVVCGDYNICHTAIDIHNPKSNAKSSGFLPEERAWMEKFFTSGFYDAFRHVNPEPHNYTWWSYRAGARGKNLGWRIDYHAITEPLLPKLGRVIILKEAMHSDHCPVLMELTV